jgi:uncharacterized protein (TIGR03663 family)
MAENSPTALLTHVSSGSTGTEPDRTSTGASDSKNQRHRPDLATSVWRAASVSILLVAAVLRLYQLDVKPLHNDEGVNAFFVLRLFQENFYHYDPANYHGPTLYYFTLLASSVSTLFFGDRGLNIVVLRLVPALFGIATVGLVLRLRDHLGTGAALAAAALVATSPGAVYFSRDFIHESVFVFLTLALVVALLRLYEQSRPASLMLASVLAALLFATKETAVISVAVLALALVSTIALASLSKTNGGGGSGRDFIWQVLDRLGGSRRAALLFLGGIAMFVGLEVIFYSSFLGNYPRGLRDALAALRFWASTGAKAHIHGFAAYCLWLGREELPLLLLGLAGTVIAAWKRKLFALFAGLWAFGLITAYSLIPYKTPWLTLNFVIPLAIGAGYAVEAIYRMLSDRKKMLAVLWLACLAMAMGTTLYKSIQLNFYRYDDDRDPYVYAQTRREFLQLVDEINEIASRSGAGTQTSIAVMSPDYWPLPWYLRDYGKAGYYGRISDARADIVIGSQPQEGLLTLLLGENYQRVGAYPLRPGVTLVAFARRHQASQ